MKQSHLVLLGLLTSLAFAILFPAWLLEASPHDWAFSLALLLAVSLLVWFWHGKFAAIYDSENRLRTIFDHAMVGIGRVSLDQYWLEANPALCRMFGLSAAELREKTFNELTHPEDREISLANFSALQRGEKSRYTQEKRYLRGDGSIIYASVAAQGVYDDRNQLESVTVAIEDVTARIEAQQELSRRIGRSSVLLELQSRAEGMDEPMFMQYALERAEYLTGSSIAFIHFVNDSGTDIELVTWSSSTLAHYCHATYDKHYPLDKAGIWADAARDRKPVVINNYASAKNKRGLPEGHSTLQRLLSIPVVEGGAVRMIVGVGNKTEDYSALDVETVQLIANETWRIVRRQRAETALQQAMQVVNASPVVCFRCAPDGNWPITFVTDNVRQWGYTPDALLAGQPQFGDLIHPDDRARVEEEVAAHIAHGKSRYEQEYRLITADNQAIWVVDRTRINRNDQGIPIHFDCILTDITDRKQQQLALSETLQHQQSLNKRLEEANNQLLQSEKMASIGQLAAGIAHELNNPIGFVHSNLGTLDGYLRDLMAIIEAYEKATTSVDCACLELPAVDQVKSERDFAFVKEDIFHLVAESKEGLGRVRKIVQDLKSFSRVGEQEWQEADLHQGLDSTLNIVWNELKYKCKVVKEYGDIPRVHCLISQLNQVFMNLLVNAGHAIETQGTITIRTAMHGEDNICVEVSDTGKGIAPEHMTRIFEPFFTTKPVGKGTGLGLSLSYSIVQRHNGRIEVESQPGQGSTFRVILPVRPAAPDETPATPA